MKNTILNLMLLASIFSMASCDKKDVDPTTDFIGTFKGTSSCNPGTQVIARISKSSSAKEGVLINLADDPISASVSGNSITIPNQTIGITTINGQGTLNGTAIAINFNFSENGLSLACAYNGIKQ
jgi:hypothetical protein